jgi:hypothetical protein
MVRGSLRREKPKLSFMALLKAQGVIKTFPGVVALNNVNLSIGRGPFTAFSVKMVRARAHW